MMQNLKSLRQVDLQVEVREVGFPEFFDEVGPMERFKILFFLFLKCLQVVEAIIGHCLNKVCLCILDLFLFRVQPLYKRFLDNVFGVGFTFEQPHGNGMEGWLVECNGLRLIQLNYIFRKIRLFIENIECRENHPTVYYTLQTLSSGHAFLFAKFRIKYPAMRTLLFILLLCGFVSSGQQVVSSADREIVFQDVNVIPMDGERVLEHQVVVIKNGRITSIGGLGKIKHGKDATVIAATGKYLIPGLAEMHAHVPPIDDMEPMKDVLTLFLANGITTIRGMLGHPRHLELRAKLKNSEILGPNFYTTGPSFNGMSVTSPEAGADMVRKQKAAGYDYLKLHPGLTRQKFDAIAAAAKEEKIPFAGHVSFGVGVWRAIEAGYSSIDHLDGFVEGMVPGIETMAEQQAGFFGSNVADKADTTQIPRLMKALKSNNIWVVPTQSLAERWISGRYTADDFKKDPDMVYMNPKVVEQWINSKNNLMNSPEFNVSKVESFVKLRRKLIRECQKNGVGLLLGCDAPQVFNVPGFSTHNELEYLVRSGLTPYEALRTGTANVGAYLNKKDSGVIKQGAVSDLILLNANPLGDIRQTRNIAGVMIGDRWLSKEYIDGELGRLRKQ